MGYISKEYVSKDVVTAALRKIKGWKYEDFLRAEKVIIDLPAADVVEVVRCKDCMHRYVVNTCPHSGYFIDHGMARVYCNAHDDDYCSRGKRK